MQENMMQFMTAVMNRLPDTGSGKKGATVAPTTSYDHRTAGGGVGNGCWDDSSSDKEN
jgi:hypothetical protein